MYMFKNRIRLEDRELLDRYMTGFDHQTSGLSFSGMYMWRDINQFSWQMIGDYMCFAGVSHLELEEGIELPFMFPPMTDTGGYDPKKLRETLYEAREHFERNGHVFSIRLMPFHMIDIIKEAVPGEMKFIEDRPNYDYVYRTRDLIDLAGRAYHGKKNHLNYFKKTFEYEYVPLTSAMAEDAMEFIREFNERKEVPPHEMELLKMEEEAMVDVFNNIEAVDYKAGAILIGGKIEALAVGGNLNKKTVTEHVEKANVNYRGLYQAINNEFCKHMAANVKYINREEDMGIPNLRRAKLSYRPYKMIEKYIATFK